METPVIPCQHQWIYYVNVASQAVRIRKCEHCGGRETLRSAATPSTAGHPVSA